MKKISYFLAIMVLASAFVFGLNTKVSALMYTIEQKDVGNIFSWDYNQLIEYLVDNGQEEIANILSEESWNNYTEPDLDSDVDPFPDFSGAGIVVIKSAGGIAFFTGNDIPSDWGDLPDGMNSISSLAVPEPGSILSLGLILLAIILVSKKRFIKKRS
jgi:hypothetical protein